MKNIIKEKYEKLFRDNIKKIKIILKKVPKMKIRYVYYSEKRINNKNIKNKD